MPPLQPLKPGSQKRSKLLERYGLLPYQHPSAETISHAPAFLTQRQGEEAGPAFPSQPNAPAFGPAAQPVSVVTGQPVPSDAALASRVAGAAVGGGPALQTAKTPAISATGLPEAEFQYPAEIAAKQEAYQQKVGGYASTYWENPNNVSWWYNRVQADPKTVLPEGIDAKTLEGVYAYMKYRNDNAQPLDWKWLNKDDPLREFLGSIPPPGVEQLLPAQQSIYGITPAAGASPAAQLDWKQPDFDWQKLTIQQKEAVIADPAFQMHEVPVAQQGLILTDPTFDFTGKAARGELPWWQPTIFTLLSNPNTAPLVQGAIIGLMSKSPVAGAMVAAMGYGEQLRQLGRNTGNPTVESATDAVAKVVETIGQGFMWGSQTLEQAQGLFQQVSGLNPAKVSALDKEPTFVSNHWANMRSEVENAGGWSPWLKAAWQAGKVYYESQTTIGMYNLARQFDKDAHLAVWVLGQKGAVPVQPNYTIEDARQRILAGESPDSVLADFSREYGVTGVASDLLLQAVYNPLNIGHEVSAEIRGALHETAAARIERGARPLTEADAARVAIERAHAQAAYQAPTMTGELIPWSASASAFRDLVRTRFGFQGISMDAMVQAMSKRELAFARLMPDGALRELQPGKPGFWNFFHNLTPESKTILSADMTKENLAVLMDWAGRGEDAPRKMYNVLAAASRHDMQTLRDMGATFLDNPEFYTSIGALRDFMEPLQRLTADYESARPNRDLFFQALNILGEEDQTSLLKHFTDGDPLPDFERLIKTARTAGTPEAKAFLDLVERRSLNADALAKAFEVFRDGRVALTPQEFKAQLLSKFFEHMGKWGVEHFGVKQATAVEEVLRGLKGAQSLLLLDLSPAYLINNFLNNRILMAAGGVLGFDRGATIDAWLNEFGAVPARLAEGFGPAGEIPAGGASTAQQVVRAATRGEGLATSFADAVGAVRRKIGVGTQLSSRIESASSKQMFYTAMRSFYGRNWRVDVGFQRMPAVLEMALKSQGIDPDAVYHSISGVLRPDDLAKVVQGVSTRTVQSYIDKAATSLGVRPEELTDMFARLGILDDLTRSVAAAKTPDDVSRAFASIEHKAMDSVDMRLAAEIRSNAEHFKNKILAEGYAGAHNVLMDVEMDLGKRWLDHFARAGEIVELSSQLDDPVARNNLWRNWRMEEQDYWRRFYAHEAAAWKGLLEGLGVDEPSKRQFLSLIAQYMDANQKVTDEQWRAYDAHFSKDFGGDRTAAAEAWGKLQDRFDANWTKAEKIKADIFKQVDQQLVQIYKDTFGPGIELSAKKWVDQKSSYHAKMVAAREAFRESIKDMPAAERQAAKWKFYQETYRQMISDFTRENIANETNLYHGIVEPGVLQQGTLEDAARAQRMAQAQERPQVAQGQERPQVAQAPEAGTAAEVDAGRVQELVDAGMPQKQAIEQARAEMGAQSAEGAALRQKINQEAQAQVEQDSAHAQSVASVAHEFGMDLGDLNGDLDAGNLVHAFNVVKRYAPSEARDIARPSDLFKVDPEALRRAFTERKKWQDTQLTLDRALQPPEGVDRRVPALERLRMNWSTLDPQEQAQVVEWLANKVATDPLTGLETLYAKTLDPKPEGWTSALSDFNGLKAINDYWGHASGDAVLQAMGEVIRQEVEAAGGRAFRGGPRGDEISYYFPSENVARATLEAIDTRLRDAIIHLEVDGKPVEKKGFTLSYGIGPDETIADAALYTDKGRRLGLGERAERGQIPGSISAAADTAGTEGPGGQRVYTPEEAAALERQTSAFQLIERQPLEHIPPVLQQPVAAILGSMLDEVRLGKRRGLLEFIRSQGGLNIKYLPDVAGEGKAQRAWGPGVFTKKGLPIDWMITAMLEEGFLTHADLDNPFDNGGVNRATELIRSALSGESVTSLRDQGKPAELPAWYAELKGFKNKQAVVQRAITLILGSQDNTAFSLDPTALDSAIKREVFNRLAEQAGMDGRLADALGVPFDYAGWRELLTELDSRVDPSMSLESLQAVEGALNTLLGVLPDKPPDAHVQDWVFLNSKIKDALDAAQQVRTLEDTTARAESVIRTQEAAGEAKMARELLREQLSALPNLTPDQVETTLQLTDARAQAWARANNATPEEWYRTRLAGIEPGGEPGPESLSQLQPVNRRMSSDEVAAYARALARAGFDEARRAVANETVPADRMALLDALHQLDPMLAERIARQVTDLLYQENTGPVWYSQLQRVVESVPMETMTVDQLRGLINKGGVRADELKWTGFDDWLAKHKGKVTKEETLNFLRENQVQVQEVNKGSISIPGETRSLIRKATNKLVYNKKTETLTGYAWGRRRVNYTEVDKVFTGRVAAEELPNVVGESIANAFLTEKPNRVGNVVLDARELSRGRTTTYGNWVVPGGENYREVLFYTPQAKGFESPHFDVEGRNLLAHTRLDDRVDAAGKRVLFVEEVQSDWHQAGREKGYQGQLSADAQAETQRLSGLRDNARSELDQLQAQYKDSNVLPREVADQINKLKQDVSGYSNQINTIKTQGVPAAPFAKTWPELVMKRVLRMAAEEGYDKVAWTTGDQQAARYDLAKQVDVIESQRNADGTYYIDAIKEGNSVVTKDSLTPDQLADTVGKDLANKIVQAKHQEGVPKRWSGEDLKVGGEGMKTFYDRMLPAFMDKYGKKWGVRTGETKFEDFTAPSVDVTPEMTRSVMQGQPLFQTKKGGVDFLADGRAIIHAFESADVSTVVHELGHVFRRDLQGSDLAIVEKWAGVKDGQWKRAHEEKFARAFERYLAEGRAPVPALEAVFLKFKTWLTAIYRSITGSAIDVNLTDEVRGVFDRLLGQERLEPGQIGLAGAWHGNQTALDIVYTFGSIQEARAALHAMEVGGEQFMQTPDGYTFTAADLQWALDLMDHRRLPAASEPAPAPAPAPRADLPPSPLFQDGGKVPLLGPDGYDQTSGYVSMAKILEHGWTDQVQPALEAMKRAAFDPEKRYSFAGLDPATQDQFNGYLDGVRSDLASFKHTTVRWGETNRDYALLNYNKQYGFDKLLNPWIPYQFFMTHSGINWLARGLDHPTWISLLAQLNRAHTTFQSQLPERLRNKIFIPMPWLPPGMGGGMWIDPTLQFFPYKQFTQPLDSFMRDQTGLASSAEFILREWAQDGTLAPEQADQALRARSGLIWQRAITEAELRQNGEGNSGFDYFTQLFSPALYLTLPYYLATGKPMGSMGFPNSQLPITRFGSSLETAFKGTSLQWIGDVAGLMARPEQWLRRARGVSEFGEWGDWYIDRQLSNMAGEGRISSQDAILAMTERKGPIFDQAVQRVRQELMLRTPTMAPLFAGAHGATLDQIVGAMLPSLFPSGLLPEGEMQNKGLKNEYNLAWERYKNGDGKAIDDFFAAHPEYEARLALKRDPANRLNQFLRSQIWDNYNALGATERKQIKAYMGPEFGRFLGADSSVDFPTDQLATWARMLGGAVPQTPATQAALQQKQPQVPQYDPATTAITDRFFQERTQKFPHYYSLQQTYYGLPKSEHPGFLQRFPEYAAYVKWRNQWYDDYPELKPIFNGEAFKTIDTSGWPPMLLPYLDNYAVTGERLPSGARKMLEQIWVREGRPLGSLQAWLDSAVVPGLRSGITPIGAP